MSRVDVIVPCYKYGRYLRQCVESVLSQEGADVRVLIIDDCSPDHTPEVGRGLAEQDRRVEYRRHDRNRGHIATYNEGIEWASSGYMLLLSADDFLFPGALFRAVSSMTSYPEIGFIHGRHTETPERSHSEASTKWTCEVQAGSEYIQTVCRTAKNEVATPTAVVRTSLQKRLGGYLKELPHSGDMEMWLRFAAVSSVGFITAYQACRRIHSLNMSEVHFRDLNDLVQRNDAFRFFFSHLSVEFPEYAHLKALSCHKLSTEAFWMASRAFDAGDLDLCRKLLELSLDIDRSIRSSTDWMRLRVKRVLGPKVCKGLRPFVDFCRRAIAIPGGVKST